MTIESCLISNLPAEEAANLAATADRIAQPSSQNPQPRATGSVPKGMQSQIKQLESEIDKLKKKTNKGAWDVFQIISAAAIPASIGLAGFFISNTVKQAEIRSSERIERLEPRAWVPADPSQAPCQSSAKGYVARLRALPASTRPTAGALH